MSNIDTTSPLEVTRSGPRAISVKWKDGHHSIYRTRGLRLGCGCANCVEEMTGRKLLQPDNVPEDMDVKSIEMTGRYGLKIVFADGHDTGIFTFKALRENCPCAACRESGAGDRFIEPAVD
jgi:ATP-binding protein involved in chromosome partitioning